MAVTAGTVFEVRADGDDLNPGGFDAAFGGTDYSQQAAAQVSFTDFVIKAYNGLAAPTAVAQSTGAGTFAAGTYYISFALVDTSGRVSQLSPETAVAITGTQVIRYTVPAMPAFGAPNQINVYLTQTPGSNQKRQAIVTNWGLTNDLTSFNAAGAAPVSPTGTSGLNIILSSAAHSALADEVGNTIKVNSGTGFTTGIYMIHARSGNDYVVDRYCGTQGSTGGAGKLGGAAKTPQQPVAAAVAGNRIWLRKNAGTLSVTSSSGASGGGLWSTQNAGTRQLPIIIEGYDTVRGDNGVWAVTVNVSLTTTILFNLQTSDWHLKNVSINMNANGVQAVKLAATRCLGLNIAVQGATGRPIEASAQYCRLQDCTVTGGTNSGSYDFQNSVADFWVSHDSIVVQNCKAIGTLNNGFVAQNSSPTLINCISSKNGTGGNGCGYGVYGGGNPKLINCIAYKNSKAGFFAGRNTPNDGGDQSFWRGNIFVLNGTYAVDSPNNWSTVTDFQDEAQLHNAFYGNVTGKYHNWPAGTGDIDMAGDPFVDGDNGNFTLNSTIGADLQNLTDHQWRYSDGSIPPGAESTPEPPIADFDEVQFPTDISRGTVGGPMFRTTIVVTGSGAEQRVVHWERPTYKWDVGLGARTPEQADALVNFFVARYGRAMGFRFKDWRDYEVTMEEAQSVSSTIWQIVKRYTSGTVTQVRTIKKPVAGTVKVYNALDVEVTTGWTVDTTTGLITFSVAPAYTPQIVCEFDVPVRFDTDEMRMVQDDVTARSWEGINVVELRF